MPDTSQTPTEGDWRVSPSGTAVMAHTADGASVVGYVHQHQESFPANVRLFAAGKVMLAALEAQQAVEDHRKTCRDCGGNLKGELWFCSAHNKLAAAAAQLRCAAIKRAKEGD